MFFFVRLLSYEVDFCMHYLISPNDRNYLTVFVLHFCNTDDCVTVLIVKVAKMLSDSCSFFYFVSFLYSHTSDKNAATLSL